MAADDFIAWYKAEGFGSNIDGTNRLDFSGDDLAHALFVTGRAPGDRVNHGDSSIWEWLHRTSIIPAYIRRAPNNRLIRSDLAVDLDRSEKVALSYSLGQAATGIFSEKVLSVAFLMHVDRYSRRYRVTFAATRKRADLFGRSPAGWVVAEAKGRSGAMPSNLRLQLVDQKRSIRTIDGMPPEISYGCVASFPANAYGGPEYLRIDAFDPTAEEPEAIDLEIDQDRFILAYYEPFLTVINRGDITDSSERGEYIIAEYASFNVRIGLPRSIVERIQGAMNGQIQGLYEDIVSLLAEGANDVPHSFLDGSIVETQWEQAFTLNDWLETGDGFPRLP